MDAGTEIDGGVQVGDLVRVTGVILPDGTWRAETIKRLERRRGCLDLTAAVRTVTAEQIVLLDWQAINLQAAHVEGEIKVATIVLLHGCVREDGTLIIVSIIAIYQLDVLPIIIV